jgi:4a-hydroxytetrahydrobiopterin dehydratase
VEVFSQQEATAMAAELSGWSLEDEGKRLSKRFVFADFARAFAFMTACALKAERMNHHPDWWNVYSRVDVKLWSHDAGGLTERDFKLAKSMDEIAAGLLG